MGTSSSYGGPRGRGGLLPPWVDDDVPPPLPGVPGVPGIPGPTWRGPKTILGRIARSGGTPSPDTLRGLGRSYVRASGGSERAAAGAVAGRAATGRLAAFATGVARDGLATTLARLGLQQLLGEDAGSAVIALVDWFAPDGALLEEAAARDATIWTLSELSDQYGIAEDGLGGFAQIGPADIVQILETSIANYLDARIQRDLLNRVERGSLDEVAAMQLSDDIKGFIRAQVRLTLEIQDPLAVDWQGREGRTLMRRLYADAYAILGGEE